MRRIFYIYFIIFYVYTGYSQADLDNTTQNNDAGFINIFSYGIDFPGGNMKKSYGYNFRFGIAPTFYFQNSNISIGFSADYLFGNTIKTNPVSNLLTTDNQIINSNPGLSSLKINERGFTTGLFISKIFPFNKDNLRTGIRIDIGPYFLSHWIHYKDEYGTIPQLDGEYKKGYDGLTGGIALKQFIGYQYLSQKSKINFYAGFEFYQGFTKNLRYNNYSTASVDKDKKTDFLFGFKIGWILPIYVIKNPEEIYY